MDSIDYKKLYELQDRVMDVIFATESIFYLTGGTALSRFYYEKCYSDDLDFFTELNEEVTFKDFIRLKINNLLQVDFVNDRVLCYGKPICLDNGYIIDTSFLNDFDKEYKILIEKIERAI